MRKVRFTNRSVGTWLTQNSLQLCELVSKCGFDWVVIDMEHNCLSISDVYALIQVSDLCDCAPLVRIPSHDESIIKRVLDAGAHGIVVPSVNDAESARKLVNWSKYPPFGRRGVGLARAQGFGPNFHEYMMTANDSLSIVIQVESIEAVSNIDEILDVSGIDGVFVGPYDLSCSLGVPGQFKSELFLKALSDIQHHCSQAGMPLGIHVVEPDIEAVAEVFANGYQFAAYSVDFRILDHAYRTAMPMIKGMR